MTPAQQSALETVAGRALTADEIVAIDALLADRNDIQIAAILSAGRVTLTPHEMGERGVLDVLGPVDGDVFLSALESITIADDLPPPLRPLFGAIHRGVAWLKTSGLDVGSTTTRAMLDGLAAFGKLNTAHVAAIKATAERPDPIFPSAISDALNEA